MKLLYIAAAIIIWIAGVVLFFAVTINYGWQSDKTDLLTTAGMVGVGGISLFSFFWGAQRGHVVRFIGLCIFFMLSVIIYANTYLELHGTKFFALIFAPMLLAVYISKKWGGKFKKEYENSGISNYFKIYFDDKRNHSSKRKRIL